MSLDVQRIKVIAFDVFGTLVRLKDEVPHEEIKAYADHIRKPEWSPLTLPESWKQLKAFDDSSIVLKMLRRHFMVVTLSNGPLGLQAALLKNNDIDVDAIVPLEIARVFKPNEGAYRAAADILGIPPENWLMVTANEKFGDLEASKAVGMQSQLIRGDEVVDLYDLIRELVRWVTYFSSS